MRCEESCGVVSFVVAVRGRWQLCLCGTARAFIVSTTARAFVLDQRRLGRTAPIQWRSVRTDKHSARRGVRGQGRRPCEVWEGVVGLLLSFQKRKPPQSNCLEFGKPKQFRFFRPMFDFPKIFSRSEKKKERTPPSSSNNDNNNNKNNRNNNHNQQLLL